MTIGQIIKDLNARGLAVETKGTELIKYRVVWRGKAVCDFMLLSELEAWHRGLIEAYKIGYYSPQWFPKVIQASFHRIKKTFTNKLAKGGGSEFKQ